MSTEGKIYERSKVKVIVLDKIGVDYILLNSAGDILLQTQRRVFVGNPGLDNIDNAILVIF